RPAGPHLVVPARHVWLAHRLPPGERMRERAPVDVLELAADRHPVGDAAGADAAPQGELAQEMRGGLALDGRVGGENELAHLPFGENRFELAYAELLGPDAIERRQMTHQNEI